MTQRASRKWWKVGGVAGIGSVVLSLVPAALVADEPRFTYSGQNIMTWYANNGDRWLSGIFVLVIAYAFFFLPFLSALVGLMEEVEGRPPMWSRVAAAGGLLFVAVAVVGLGGEGIVSYLTKDAGPDVARAGTAFALFIYCLSGVFAAVFVSSASVIILQRGVFWTWLGWYGFAVAVVNVVGATAIFGTPDGPLGVLRTRVAPPVLALWIVAASVGLLRVGRSARTVTLAEDPSREATSGHRDGVRAGIDPTHVR